MENPSYNLTSELLILYDFPKGFDEQGLAGLRNILRNGSKCGIYTLILYSPATVNGRDEFVQSLKTIESLSVVIRQQGESFIMRGMPLLYPVMPDKTNFAKFFSKYMLIFEGIKNRGIAFSPLIKRLVDADSMEELARLKEVLESLPRYDKIQLNTATRPPADSDVKALSEEELQAVAEVLGLPCEIIASWHKKSGGEMHDAKVQASDVLELVRCHPSTAEDVANGLVITNALADRLIARLLSEGSIQAEERAGKTYYIVREEDQIQG